MCLTLHTPKFHLCQVFFTHPSFIVSCFLLGRDNGEDLLPLVNEYVVSARIAPAIPVMIVTNIKYGVQSVTKVALRYPKAIAIPKRIEKTRIRLSGSAPLTYCGDTNCCSGHQVNTPYSFSNSFHIFLLCSSPEEHTKCSGLELSTESIPNSSRRFSHSSPTSYFVFSVSLIISSIAILTISSGTGQGKFLCLPTSILYFLRSSSLI